MAGLACDTAEKVARHWTTHTGKQRCASARVRARKVSLNVHQELSPAFPACCASCWHRSGEFVAPGLLSLLICCDRHQAINWNGGY